MKDFLKYLVTDLLLISVIGIGGYQYVNYDSYDPNAPYSYNMVEDFFNFDAMYTKDYEQCKYKSNCGPTAACNVISYLEKQQNEKFIEKENGKVPQNVYDKMCKDMKYNIKLGTKTGDINSYIEDYFEENTNRECNIKYLYHKKWSKVKEAIDDGKILNLFYKEHVYIIGGYEEEEGERWLIVFTNWNEDSYMIFDFEKDMNIYEVELK